MTRRATRHQERVTAELRARTPRFPRSYGWNAAATMRVEMDPTRLGFGRALDRRGDDPRIVCLGEDILRVASASPISTRTIRSVASASSRSASPSRAPPRWPRASPRKD